MTVAGCYTPPLTVTTPAGGRRHNAGYRYNEARVFPVYGNEPAQELEPVMWDTLIFDPVVNLLVVLCGLFSRNYLLTIIVFTLIIRLPGNTCLSFKAM